MRKPATCYAPCEPTFPERFGSVQEARSFCQGFFPWYNTEHRHDALGLLTSEAVHHGRVDAILEQRRSVLEAAYAAHPERFVRKPPEPLAPPTAAWINPPGSAALTALNAPRRCLKIIDNLRDASTW